MWEGRAGEACARGQTEIQLNIEITNPQQPRKQEKQKKKTTKHGEKLYFRNEWDWRVVDG